MIKLPSLILLTLISIITIHGTEVPKCVLSGEIKNPVSDSLFIENDNGELVKAIGLNKKKHSEWNCSWRRGIIPLEIIVSIPNFF